MGIFGDILKNAINGLQNTNREMRENAQKFESYDDRKLVRMAREGSFAEKTAACNVLKERYGTETAREMIKRG